MEPWIWEVLALIAAAVLLNSVGFMAWKRGVVGPWFGGAVAAATLAVLVGDDLSHWLRASGAVALLLLGLYGLVMWGRHRRTADRTA